MRIDLEHLTVKFNADTSDRLTENWTWLIGADKKVLMISEIGDMFLTDSNEKIYWLDVGVGDLQLVAESMEDFYKKLEDSDQVNEWFLVKLTTELRFSTEKALQDGQVYSYYRLPIIGGEYVVDNFGPLNIEEHFGYLGHIHKQIKDLPDGTKIEIRVVD